MGPVVFAAGDGEAVDGTHEVSEIDIRAKIAACDSAAGQRVGSFFHDLRGLLKYPRSAAGHRVQCRGKLRDFPIILSENPRLQIAGPYALPDQIPHDEGERWNEPPIGPDWAGTLAPQYFNYRKTTIYGGSNEIQKNIIAKAILGL